MKRRNFLELSFGAAFAQGVPAWDARPADVRSIKPVSIDMHTHWAPEAYVKAQVEMGRPAPANPNPLDFDLDKRRKWMDEHGIQMHVLTLSGGAPWQWATPEQGARLAQIVNDAAIQAHTAFPAAITFAAAKKRDTRLAHVRGLSQRSSGPSDGVLQTGEGIAIKI